MSSFTATRRVFLKDDRLVDGNGDPIKVESRGEHFEVKLNHDFVRRLVGLHGRHLLLPGNTPRTEAARHDFRNLGETVPIATVADIDAHTMYENSLNGIRQSITVIVNDKTYSGILGSGVQYTPTNAKGCEEYNEIKEEGTTYPTYKAVCCGSGNDCDVYDLDAHRNLYFPGTRKN